MALPDELLDELLSAHLDGALSGDECARIEQLLRDDPLVGQRLNELRDQRDAFRLTALATPALSVDFADHVVQAAIDRAQAESLPSDHPLQLAAKESLVSRRSPSGSDPIAFSKSRLVTVIAGLAASILFIAVIVNKFGGQTLPQLEETKVAAGPNPGSQLPGSQRDPASDSPGPLVAPESVVSPSATMIASEPIPAAVPKASDPTDIEVDINSSPSMVPQPVAPRLADSGDSAKTPPLSPESSERPPVKTVAQTPAITHPLNMLLVIEIEQTDTGRVTGAFDQALASVEIALSHEREVDEALARAVTRDPGSEVLVEGDRRVVLLESPAKKLDKLVNQLMVDRNGIRAMGFSAITVQLDAPLLRSVESVRTVDPTKIRHQGQSVPIVSQSDDLLEAWVSELGNRKFAPVRGDEDAEMVRMMAAGSTSPLENSLGSNSDDGPDQMANILFLIR